jgi:YD repeat-containing protein
LLAHYVLSPVIEEQHWIKNSTSDSSFLAGKITLPDTTNFKPAKQYYLQSTSPLPALNNETIDNSGNYTTLLPDTRYEERVDNTYDHNANLIRQNMVGGELHGYIWDYSHAYPIAAYVNADTSSVAYTSFESDGTGNWTRGTTESDYTAGVTGTHCYTLNSDISKSNLSPATTYTVSYWVQGSPPFTIPGTINGYPLQGKTVFINGANWTYYEHRVTGQSTVSIQGSGNIDELRLYPVDAQMTTYTYAPLVGMTSQCDINNRVTYYDYDSFKRLQVVRDQDGNIVKTVQYHYQGQ